MRPFILLACLFALSACTTPVAPEVSGVVRDAQTGQGIPGVRIMAQRADYTREVYAKPGGSYVIPSITQWHYLWKVPAPWWTIYSRMAPYEISAEKPGYVKRGISFVPDEERKAHWDFVLEPAKTGDSASARKTP